MNLFNIRCLIHIFLPWNGHAGFLTKKMFLLVLSYFPLMEASNDMELAYGSVCAHTLLNVNRTSARPG